MSNKCFCCKCFKLLVLAKSAREYRWADFHFRDRECFAPCRILWLMDLQSRFLMCTSSRLRAEK
jgi:hypothetical protein